jgi:hypothetical protein
MEVSKFSPSEEETPENTRFKEMRLDLLVGRGRL